MNTPATNFPTLAEAKLPATYEAARTAIAECDRVDECKDWSDKAAAIASYARQAKDDSLAVMARRIQARAERRGGELLKVLPPSKGGRPTKTPDGADIGLSRTKAASNAGLSERQKVTMLRVASVPRADFDAMVESARPPSITQLSNLGKETRPTAGPRSPWQDIECAEARRACETLDRFAECCKASSTEGIARAVNATEVQRILRLIEVAGKWLDQLHESLSAEA